MKCSTVLCVRAGVSVFRKNLQPSCLTNLRLTACDAVSMATVDPVTGDSLSVYNMTCTQREVFKCVLSGDLEYLKEFFEPGESQEESQEEDVFGLKDEAGRNVLLTAAMLGRSAIVQELVRHGARVNEQTAGGYSSLHLAACWGHLETVKTLLELGADTQTNTFKGERPVDLARKYSKTDCADCLILAEAKQDLVSYLAFVKDLISDAERNMTKEEKNICTRACSAKSDWIQTAKHSTVSDYRAQRKDIEDTLQPILNKLSAQCKCFTATNKRVGAI
ncbi:Ankyrin repeat domain-containing protein 45 [Collichthys lucidus]|uniref:Ankyrin repeat domain-containing protein 45 n=1 Tax=Collichthys lucidus TaxID=240159 RepID=A0A4U5UZX2_COLLU|nr:Ankyrin repeat domain-containing protein 45 [Collichthys lucidus]